MNTKPLTNLKSKRMLGNILSICVILALAFPATGHATAQEAQPRIVASITHDWFRAEEFSSGGTLNLKLFDQPSGSLLWEENRTADGSGFLFVGDWEHPVDLKPGHYLVISDAFTTKDLVLEAIRVDVFDPAADVLQGIAPQGRLVWVGVGNNTSGCGMEVTADPVTGEWSADFSSQPCDVMYDMWAAAQVFDEDGDATEGNLPRNPIFTVFPEWETVEGWGWTQDATVHLAIDDPATALSPDYSQDAGVGPTPWNPNEAWVRFEFAGDYDAKPGDLVALSEGNIVRTYTVQNLAITGVSETEDTVAGTADPGVLVNVWPHATGQQVESIVDPGGTWEVDFTEIFDLIPGESGRSEVRDEFGNATAVDWYIPDPRFVVFPEWEWFDGLDWPDGAIVSISVEGKTACSLERESWGGFFNGNFPEGCEVQIGDTVTFTDGETVRTHTVRNLLVTKVDHEDDTVKGIADAGAEVHVWPHATGQEQLVIAKSKGKATGKWNADFTGIFDLAPGECGRSEIRDESGNATAVDWCVPNPRFSAFPDWEYIEGWEWPQRALVHMTIDDPGTEVSPDFAQDEPVLPTDWDPNLFWVTFNFAGMYDMKVGDIVTLNDGTTTRTHTVLNLTITGVDADANTVSGTADAGAVVNIWAHATGEQLTATADSGGNWLVDIGAVFDLVPGECGRAEIRDRVDHLWTGATAVDWCVPWPPRIVVQITDDWFRAENFATSVPLDFWIYDTPNGNLLFGSTTPETDSSGTVAHWVGDQVDLLPGYQIIVSDGVTTKDIVLEALTFDVFDTSQGILQGTAPKPFGRGVWVGIGWENEGWSLDVTTEDTGAWTADFGAPVPAGYGWVAAQVFDLDGDASEVRPALIID